ncbi:hypothetical protein [Sinomonas gamaensis]|uniref:hypothetical protein n=1 Tax=Sinomonas gamaensis TaxID=2565624 RepID=UPI00110838E7|nr:hypothetical protein [Sinomonas gamaensis]
MTATAPEPGDALAEAITTNAREIRVLLLVQKGYTKTMAERTYDQDPEARKVFVDLAGAQARRIVAALGQDWDTLAESTRSPER